MPSHWGHKALTSCRNRAPPARNACTPWVAPRPACLYGQLTDIPGREGHFKSDEVAYVSIGDGTTSEGEFWESLSTACVKQLPVVFMIEDNGLRDFGTGSKCRRPGGDLSKLVEGYPGLKVLRCDGTDVLESIRVMNEAVAYCRARKGPSLVHAKVVRPYSHSLSDDEKVV
jgi:2-oxoisovalerate dehydrogenase E1 component